MTMQLIYVSPVPWRSFAQRPHKFVEWFHSRTNGHVIWVEPYPTRFPRSLDFLRLIKERDIESDAPPNWITLIRAGFIVPEPIPGAFFVNRCYWSGTLKTILKYSLHSTGIVVIGKPSAFSVALLESLSGYKSIYDSMDDFSAFYYGLASVVMARNEAKIASHVDQILVSSSKLLEKWSGIEKDVLLIRNGLDENLLLPISAKPMGSFKQKHIFGYVGTVAGWFDWRWITLLAESRPDDEVHIVGPILLRPKEPLPDNIIIFPPCDHASALDRMKCFDVGIIPFLISPLTEFVDPIKYYEYRSLGLPIMSTCFGDMAARENQEGVFLSHSNEEILALSNAALSYVSDSEDMQRFVSDNNWSNRFNAIGII